MAAPLLQARRGEWIGFGTGEENLLRIDSTGKNVMPSTRVLLF
jgi:hypothetical protein